MADYNLSDTEEEPTQAEPAQNWNEPGPAEPSSRWEQLRAAGYQPPHTMRITDHYDALEGGPRTRIEQFAPMLNGMPLSPGEAGIAQVQQALGSTQLSQQEQAALQRYQNGLGAIAEQQANGTLSPQDAQQLQQRIAAAAQPLQIRASQLPILMMREQYLHLQHQNAQAAAIAQQTRAFNARTAPDGLHTVVHPQTGEQAHFVEDSHGRLHPVEFPSQAGGGGADRQRAQAEQRHSALVANITRQVDQELQHARTEIHRRDSHSPPQTHPERPWPEWVNYDSQRGAEQGAFQLEADRQNRINRLVRQHYENAGLPMPGSQAQTPQQSQGTPAPTTSPGATQGAPTPTTPSAATPPPPGPPLPSLDHIRQRLATPDPEGTHPAVAEGRQRMRDLVARADAIQARNNGPNANWPEAERRAYRDALRDIQDQWHRPVEIPGNRFLRLFQRSSDNPLIRLLHPHPENLD